jgi:hypothetical protein
MTMTDETGAIVTDPVADIPEAAPAPSLSDRAAAVIAQMEHNMRHNAPVSLELLREVKALLGGKDGGPAPEPEQTAD